MINKMVQVKKFGLMDPDMWGNIRMEGNMVKVKSFSKMVLGIKVTLIIMTYMVMVNM